MTTRRRLVVAALAGLFAGAASGPAAAADKNAKYYFKIHEINLGKNGGEETAAVARELLEKELASRSEFTSDVGPAREDQEIFAELKRRQLKGFKVSLRLDRLTREPRPPKPGGRLKQLGVDIKLSVFGTTFPGEKLSFSGDGEAAIEAEVVERRMDEEAAAMVKDVMAQALRQAVDQAVMKLSLPKSQPMNESKRKKRKK